MRIITFEWKKLLKLKAFISLLIITILFIAGLFCRNYIYQDIVKSESVEYFQNHSSTVLSQLITDQEYLKEIGEGVDPILDKSIDVGKALYGKLQELLAAINTDEHLTALHIENEVYELAINYQTLGRYYPLSKMEMDNETKLNLELLKKGLSKEDLTASIQPAVFMKQTVQLLINSFGFFILLMVVCASMVREFDENTIKLTYVLPVSSLRLVLSKWLSLVLSGVTWLLIVFFSSYIISILFGKKESNPFDYPFFTEQMTFITARDYLQQAIVFSLFYLLVLMSLFMFVSFLMKNTLIVHIVLLILFVGNLIMIKSGFVYSFMPWSYQELDIVLLQRENASLIVTILSILLLTIVLLLLAIKSSKRREYQS